MTFYTCLCVDTENAGKIFTCKLSLCPPPPPTQIAMKNQISQLCSGNRFCKGYLAQHILGIPPPAAGASRSLYFTKSINMPSWFQRVCALKAEASHTLLRNQRCQEAATEAGSQLPVPRLWFMPRSVWWGESCCARLGEERKKLEANKNCLRAQAYFGAALIVTDGAPVTENTVHHQRGSYQVGVRRAVLLPAL